MKARRPKSAAWVSPTFSSPSKRCRSSRTFASAISSSPSALEHSTSSNDWYYMERSDAHDAFFQPFNYVTGVMAFDSYWDDRATAAISFAESASKQSRPLHSGAGPGEYAATGRLTVLPLYEEEGRRLVHAGIGYSYSGTDDHNFDTANRRWSAPVQARKRCRTSSRRVRSSLPTRCKSLMPKSPEFSGGSQCRPNTNSRGRPTSSSSSTRSIFRPARQRLLPRPTVCRDGAVSEPGRLSPL